MKFSQDYFGHYFHHQPNEQKDLVKREQVNSELEVFLNYIYDNLGEKTLRQWFSSSL